jgi:Recombination enhancement, RecA-dependent nuclease
VNLTGRPVAPKGQNRKSRGKARPASAAERRHWARVRAIGCIIGNLLCQGRTTIHHCGTRRGGRKDHMKVIPLCWEHHLGGTGIDGKRMSFAEWQEKFGTEEEHLATVALRLS